MQLRHCVRVFVGALAFAFVHPALAQSVPSSTYSSTLYTNASACSAGPNTCDGVSSVYLSNYGTTDAVAVANHATANLTAAPNWSGIAPSLGVNGTFEVGGDGSAESATFDAKQYLTYYMMIAGPTGSVSVDVNAAGAISGKFLAPINLTSSTQFNGSAYASLTIDKINFAQTLSGVVSPFSNTASYGNNLSQSFGSAVTTVDGFSGSFALSQNFEFQTNTLYTISMAAYAVGGVSAVRSSGQIGAFVDPTFALNSSVADPSLYSFQFSNGLGATSSVAELPEPATWAMMLFGFAGIGFQFRRKRRAQSSSGHLQQPA